MATKVTIQDIANELQLSRNTVSKAINNTGVLADATREKILRKAAEMGYKQFAYLPLFQEDTAKAAEHSILPSDKREIAMLTTQFLSSSHFSSMMLDRFQSEIEHLHSCTTIHRISPIELKEKKLPSSLNIQRTAGIICIEVFDYDYAQMLCDLDVPLLFVDTPVMDMRPPLKADRLYMENRIEVQNAVAHMVQRGKKRISFAGDKNHCQSFFERYMAYKDAVEYFGLTEGLSTCAMPSGQQNYPVSLYETIRRFKTMPDAFVCANDFVAMDLVKALNELGYSVPDDIWVCGFDDSQEASYFAPHLTSIHIHGPDHGLHRCQSAYDPHRRAIAELSHRLYGNQPDPARIHRRLSERRTPMRDLCNTDKPLFAVLTKLTYSAYLNILWLVCSLPIVTIGASTTALFYVTLKMAEDRDDGLTRMFFKAFRENFKPATKLWLILLTVGSFLAADGFVLRRMWSENIFWTLLTAVLIGAAVLYGIVLLYAFPLLARFENTTFGILKTAFLVGVRYLFCTLLMAAIYGIMGYVIVFVFTPAFLLGMGFCAMLCSFLMLRILYQIGGDPDAVHEESDHDKN